MNRMHKYRAWDTFRNKMWSAEELGADEMTINPDGRGFVNVDSRNSRFSDYYPHLLLLQFTGCHDKNGKDIFDGDILSDGVTLYVVEYSEYSCGFHARNKRTIWSLWHLAHKHNAGKEIVIVGNIYENPDLLKG